MRKLLEQRSRIVKEMRALTEAPAGDGGDLTAEQQDLFDKLKAELGSMEQRIERQAILDEAERRMNGTPVTGDLKLDKEMRSFSLARAIQRRLGAKVDAQRELEISAELARLEGRSTEGFFMPYSVFEQRAGVITTGAPAAGSNVIGTDHLGNQFIDLLREANPLTGLGVRTLTGLVGNVEIPRLKQSTSVGWFGEDGDIPQTDAAFDKVTLAPKHVGAWCEYSRNRSMNWLPRWSVPIMLEPGPPAGAVVVITSARFSKMEYGARMPSVLRPSRRASSALISSSRPASTFAPNWC
jgi:HK97 family phage major capsid protein